MRRMLVPVFFLAPCASAKPDPEAPAQAAPAYLEILGDYHGRQLELSINGAAVASGSQHLLPAGTAWREPLPPTRTVDLKLTIEPCETSFQRSFSRQGEPALIIDGCDIRLVQ